jgi:Protein of unknown function (DUF3828)
MKMQLFKMSWVPVIILWFFTACTPGNDTQAMDSLKTFYQSYIRETSKVPEDHAKVEALKAKHCTSKFLGELAEAELEADPFLNVQDVEETWADNLDIAADAAAKNQFSVCFTATYDKSKHCVNVTMVDEGGSWKIDNVVN